MNARAVFQPIALSAALAASLLAQEPQKPSQKSEIQVRAEALMDRARHLSDIRAKNAPAFRLQAKFFFVGKDLENEEGSYTEIWVSDSRWRRETVVNNFHRVEIGTPDRIWKLDNSKDFPETAARLPDLMNMFPAASASLEFESITDRTDQKPAEQCATSKLGSQQEKYRFCFDRKSGALLAKLSPQIRAQNMTDYSCFYGIFRKSGEFWFPHEMACLEGKHRQLEAKVEELSADPSPAASLFTPPPGAIELGRCSGASALPVATFQPEPGFPTGIPPQDSSVALSLIVDARGRPQAIKVSQSGGKDFDDDALTAVGKWRYKPGTCEGEPMPVEIKVIVDFRIPSMRVPIMHR
jgi:TonB family protein